MKGDEENKEEEEEEGGICIFITWVAPFNLVCARARQGLG